MIREWFYTILDEIVVRFLRNELIRPFKIVSRHLMPDQGQHHSLKVTHCFVGVTLPLHSF